MTIRGAGIIPFAFFQGEEYLLLGEEGPLFHRHWGDLGGQRDPGETVIHTAARETHEESRGVLGSKLSLLFRLLWPMEKVLLRQYRSYFCRWTIANLQEIPTRFQTAQRDGHIFNEIRQLEWLRVTEVFDAAMTYRPGSGTGVYTVAGKRISRRCIGVLRRSNGYARHAASQVERISSSGSQALIRLKNGRIFSVVETGASSQDLVLENRTVVESLWQRIKSYCLWVIFLNPTAASRAEREAVFHALQQESLMHRLLRNF